MLNKQTTPITEDHGQEAEVYFQVDWDRFRAQAAPSLVIGLVVNLAENKMDSDRYVFVSPSKNKKIMIHFGVSKGWDENASPSDLRQAVPRLSLIDAMRTGMPNGPGFPLRFFQLLVICWFFFFYQIWSLSHFNCSAAGYHSTPTPLEVKEKTVNWVIDPLGNWTQAIRRFSRRMAITTFTKGLQCRIVLMVSDSRSFSIHSKVCSCRFFFYVKWAKRAMKMEWSLRFAPPKVSPGGSTHTAITIVVSSAALEDWQTYCESRALGDSLTADHKE